VDRSLLGNVQGREMATKRGRKSKSAGERRLGLALSLIRWAMDRQTARYGVLVLLVILTAATLYMFREVMMPFFLAIFLAYLLDPLIRAIARVRILRWKIHRGVAIILVYAGIAYGLGAGAYYGVPKLAVELNKMAGTLPVMLDQFERDVVRPLDREMGRLFRSYGAEADAATPAGVASKPTPAPAENHAASPASPLKQVMEEYIFIVRQADDRRYEIIPHRKRPRAAPGDYKPVSLNQQVSEYFTQLRGDLEANMGEFLVMGRRLMQGVSQGVFLLFLVFMLAAFIMVNPARIGSFMRTMIPQAHQPVYQGWVAQLDKGLGGVVRGQVVICLLNGTLTGVGIAVLGVPFWFTLSVFATVFSLIPIFGVLISTIPIVIMALTVSLYTALLAIAWVLVIHFLEGNFFNPKILGDAAKIHPVLIVFALVVGQHIAGVMGALLAVPIFSIVYNSFHYLKIQAEGLEQRT
jgi:predicted PurR-regulated permease PerM